MEAKIRKSPGDANSTAGAVFFFIRLMLVVN